MPSNSFFDVEIRLAMIAYFIHYDNITHEQAETKVASIEKHIQNYLNVSRRF